MNKKLLYILNIILGLLILSYVIYIRLVITRLPKNLYIIENDYIKINILCLIILSISISLYMVILNIRYNKEREKSKFTDIFFKVICILENALKETHYFIIGKIPDNYDKMSYLAKHFYNIFKDKSETFFIFILFSIRIIILLAFLTDIYISFELNYMYKALYLLCISLIIKFWFYTLTDFASNLEEIKETLIINDLGFDHETNLPITNYQLKKDFKHLDLKYQVQEYILCNTINGYLNNYYRYSSFLTPYFNIIIFSIYLIGWLYVFIQNIIALNL